MSKIIDVAIRAEFPEDISKTIIEEVKNEIIMFTSDEITKVMKRYPSSLYNLEMEVK